LKIMKPNRSVKNGKKPQNERFGNGENQPRR
jgi:hypothetical protein